MEENLIVRRIISNEERDYGVRVQRFSKNPIEIRGAKTEYDPDRRTVKVTKGPAFYWDEVEEEVIKMLKSWYKVQPNKVIVIYDPPDNETGKIKEQKRFLAG